MLVVRFLVAQPCEASGRQKPEFICTCMRVYIHIHNLEL